MFTNLVLPPRCMACGTLVQQPHSLCSPCWQRLTFITRPWCERCGLPKVFETGGDCLCVGFLCRYARSALVYDTYSSPLVLAFKHADKTQLTRLLARWLHSAALDILPSLDCFMPVPLHWQRLLKRKYNQSALLAASLAKSHKKPFINNVLKRVRITPPQQSLQRQQRLRNLNNAFAVQQAERIMGKHVGLVDDVWTTGATLTECTKMLLEAGAASVSWLCIARVLRGEERDFHAHPLTQQELAAEMLS